MKPQLQQKKNLTPTRHSEKQTGISSRRYRSHSDIDRDKSANMIACDCRRKVLQACDACQKLE